MIEQIKKGCKNKTEMVRNIRADDVNFWWDIENDWFLYPVEYHDTVINALEKQKPTESLFRKLLNKFRRK